MSNVLAGIGRGQLKVLDRRVEQKRFIINFYNEHLSGLDGLKIMPVQDYDKPNYWLSCILLSGKVKPVHVVEVLETENIESRPIWKPMHLQPFFQEYDFVTLHDQGSVSEAVFGRGVCLPSDTKMTGEDLERVVAFIRGLWR